MGLEGKFTLFDSVFTMQLSAHSNEMHPKQSASVKLPVRSQVAQVCAEADEIQPFFFTVQVNSSSFRYGCEILLRTSVNICLLSETTPWPSPCSQRGNVSCSH